ncbi:Trifunctional NAD biosynthesis/regulator protein NadR [candidate division SR1 bacterium Aalborg_AAW-1]|nr:Trifunctional NAD biosynthesis/regulator protein NadR [candidate division SR1 bacterium Aalborg_AAW-1]
MKKYNNGLIIGKFMPFHLGHEELITFGLERSHHLTIGVCSISSEPIPGEVRYKRVKDTYKEYSNISVIHITEDLPSSSESSREISLLRSTYLKKEFPTVDVIFTSEPYGDYVAEYMNIDHVCFDLSRNIIPISGTMIRNNPLHYRNYLNQYAKSYFTKKIIIVGSESTGKSTMTQLLANYYDTTYVPEMARLIISHTNTVTYNDLYHIAHLHYKEIKKREKTANKFLFIDSDISITESYSQFLFKKKLIVGENIRKTNIGDLYLFLNTDCPYTQDGTRIEENRRKNLEESHKRQLRENNIDYHVITGSDWNQRFEQCITIINNHFISLYNTHHDGNNLTLSEHQYHYLHDRRLSDELYRICRNIIQHTMCVSRI